MDRQRTLVDVIQQLTGCLDDLDKLGSVVAAAHLSACLDALAGEDMMDAHLSTTE
ncbi:MAG: hypothetical protein KGN34_15775 [Sphingomonadales bacterium]|nr:hypothetical protein [Sphingomonadales bacterium]